MDSIHDVFFIPFAQVIWLNLQFFQLSNFLSTSGKEKNRKRLAKYLRSHRNLPQKWLVSNESRGKWAPKKALWLKELTDTS